MSFDLSRPLSKRLDLYASSSAGLKYPASIPITINPMAYEEDLEDVDVVYRGPDGRVYGQWIMGNNYRKASALYGSYPHGYLERATAFFPDAEKVLHLFSGGMQAGPYVRFDCNPERSPDVVGDAEELAKYFEPNTFDVIYADPPYSKEDSFEHYGTPLVNRNIVLRQAHPILKSGGYLVWLDQVHPMYRKDQWCPDGFIGMVKSTQHRYRCTVFFRKL